LRCYLTCIWLAVLLLITGAVMPVYAQDTGEGTVEGQVLNGTAGGGSVAGVEVTLISYINDALGDTTTATTDDTGNFRFDGVNPEHQYIVTIRYMGVDYYYPVEFESGAAAYVEVGVCDTTNSDDLIRAGINHKIVEIEAESLKITEVLWLVNDGDKTYVRPDGVLDFTLPRGASGFEAPEELLIDFQLLGENTVTYLVPFPPGERQIIYSYRLDKPDGDELDISLVVDYPADSVELLVDGDDIEVSVGQLAPAEPVITGDGERFIHFHGENIPRGMTINLRIENLSSQSGFPLYVIWIIIGVVIAVTAVFMVIRRRKRGGGDVR
jgi:hypothetical protein